MASAKQSQIVLSSAISLSPSCWNQARGLEPAKTPDQRAAQAWQNLDKGRKWFAVYWICFRGLSAKADGFMENQALTIGEWLWDFEREGELSLIKDFGIAITGDPRILVVLIAF